MEDNEDTPHNYRELANRRIPEVSHSRGKTWDSPCAQNFRLAIDAGVSGLALLHGRRLPPGVPEPLRSRTAARQPQAGLQHAGSTVATRGPTLGDGVTEFAHAATVAHRVARDRHTAAQAAPLAARDETADSTRHASWAADTFAGSTGALEGQAAADSGIAAWLLGKGRAPGAAHQALIPAADESVSADAFAIDADLIGSAADRWVSMPNSARFSRGRVDFYRIGSTPALRRSVHRGWRDCAPLRLPPHPVLRHDLRCCPHAPPESPLPLTGRERGTPR